MPIKSLSQSSLTNFQKYSSMLAGNAAFSPGAYDLLETQILASSAASVTFTGLGSYSDYKHLQVRYVARSDDTTGSSDFLTWQYNSDSGANYAWHRLIGNGSSVSSLAATSETYLRGSLLPQATDTANIFGAGIIDILDFASSSKNTTSRNLGGARTVQTQITLYSGLYVNTSAITSITLASSEGSLIAGSRFSLYGIR